MTGGRRRCPGCENYARRIYWFGKKTLTRKPYFHKFMWLCFDCEWPSELEFLPPYQHPGHPMALLCGKCDECNSPRHPLFIRKELKLGRKVTASPYIHVQTICLNCELKIHEKNITKK